MAAAVLSEASVGPNVFTYLMCIVPVNMNGGFGQSVGYWKRLNALIGYFSVKQV